MGINRCDLMIKSLKLIDLLNRRTTVTSIDVAEELGVCKQNGRMWLQAASIVLPLYSPNEEGRRVNDFIKYGLLKGGEK